MAMTVSPKAISDVERRWMGKRPEVYDQLQRDLIEAGHAPETASRLVRHLDLLGRDPRLAVDSSTGQTRWRWRRILREHEERSTPPKRRRQGGFTRPMVATAVTLAAGGAASGHVAAGAALAGLVYITGPEGFVLDQAA